MTRRSSAYVAKRARRATLSDASKRAGEGYDPLAPMDEAGDCCYWCGDKRSTRLKVERVGENGCLGYGTYCVDCKADGSGKKS